MRRALLLCALSGLGTGASQAAPPAVDADLLEFLGSIDSDDEGWQEYLEHKPVKPSDKAASKQPVKQQSKTAPPKPEEKKVQDK